MTWQRGLVSLTLGAQLAPLAHLLSHLCCWVWWRRASAQNWGVRPHPAGLCGTGKPRRAGACGHPPETSHVGRSECHAGLGSSAPSCLVHPRGGTRELCRAGTLGQCVPESLLFGSQKRERWAVWLHCKEANPVFPVSSASATPGKGTAALLETVWISLAMSQIPMLGAVPWAEERAAQRRGI